MPLPDDQNDCKDDVDKVSVILRKFIDDNCILP